MPEPKMVPLPGSERAEQPEATRIGPVPDDETVLFSVVVRPREGAPDMGEVARYAAITGRFLSREELAKTAAPDPADVQAVEEYAHRSGLTVEGVDPVTRRVKLGGSAAAVKQAFGVSLDRYEHRGVKFRGRTGPVLIPESLEGIVVGVLGTDDRPMAHRHISAVPLSVSGDSVPMTAVQMASYYKYPDDLDGTEQCIGIVEFGGGYFMKDVSAYFERLEINPPSIVALPVAGGSNKPAPGVGLTTDPEGLATAEVELDIEVAGSAAPGARLAVYFVGTASTDNWVDAISAAVSDRANNPSVLSIGWGLAEDAAPGQFLAAADQALASAAAAGLTVLIAAGDQGSTDSWGQQSGPPDALAHVNFPASSPNATGVGGTVLRPDGSGGVAGEAAWNNGTATAASGGGVSAFFPVPSYQSAAGISPVSANLPNKPGREVPDVSANAASYRVFVRGKKILISGTSAATPLWAALIARVNQGIDGRVGLLQPMLYGGLRTAGALNDIMTGGNGACTAGVGWDAYTGLGSPNGTAILTGYRAVRQVAVTPAQLSKSPGNPGGLLTVTAAGSGPLPGEAGQAPHAEGKDNGDVRVAAAIWDFVKASLSTWPRRIAAIVYAVLVGVITALVIAGINGFWARADIQTLRDQVTGLTGHVNDLNGEVGTLTSQNTKLNDSVNSLESSKAALKNSLCNILQSAANSGQWSPSGQAVATCGPVFQLLSVARPQPDDTVPMATYVSGTVNVRQLDGETIWFGVSTPGVPGTFLEGNWQAKTGPAMVTSTGAWTSPGIFVGQTSDTGKQFNIVIILANGSATNQFWKYLQQGAKKGSFPPMLQLPAGAHRYKVINVVRK